MPLHPLPIDSHLADINACLHGSNSLVLQAPPGTGKTTRVAPSILNSGKFAGAIALIQPRRIAARAAATRIAMELNCKVGGLVGYQVRFDNQCTSQTRLVSMTPGILLRRLQSDPLLESFSTVVLDEFHERSLEMDLLLGMIRQLQVELRPELRIVVMSATLDTGSLIEYLGKPPVLSIDAQSYPVDIRHSRFEAPQPRFSPTRRIIESTLETIQRAASEQSGDMLVFLPGVGEIMQVRSRLENYAARQGWQLLTLYGDMSPVEQDRVLNPGVERRVILATNIAETSLTIEGVRIVVDSGWARVKRFDPNSGLDALCLEPISQASATQRTGRAGRTQSGVCYRLWDEITGRSRPAQLEPEILRTDLAAATLQLLSWGQTPEQFAWLTRPKEEAIRQARSTLEYLAAIEGKQLTALGNTLLKFPLHPRLARLLVTSHQLSIPTAGAMAAALLSERDLFIKPQSQPTTRNAMAMQGVRRRWNCDITHRVRVWNSFLQDHNEQTELGTINISAANNLGRTADQFLKIVQQELGQSQDTPLVDQLQRALLAAFPDRLAKRRSANTTRGLMVGGRGVDLQPSSGVQAELFLCLDVDAGGTEASVRSASEIPLDWLSPPLLRQLDERFFHPTQRAVVTRRRQYWIDLLLAETPLATPTDEITCRMLSREASRQFDRLLPPKDKELHSLLARIRWLKQVMPEADLPAFSSSETTGCEGVRGPNDHSEALEPVDILGHARGDKDTDNSLAIALRDWCMGYRSLDELKQLPWKSLVTALLTPHQKKLLDQAAPESIELPSGRIVLLQYEPGKPPVLAARIQEFFGWKATPALAGGRVPLTLHLLAPNQRCQQITDDLASFWKNTYPTVRKELRGRYPKHDWPEDPLQRS